MKYSTVCMAKSSTNVTDLNCTLQYALSFQIINWNLLPFFFRPLGQRAISYAIKHLFKPTNTAAEDIQDMSSACCVVSRKPLDNLPWWNLWFYATMQSDPTSPYANLCYINGRNAGGTHLG